MKMSWDELRIGSRTFRVKAEVTGTHWTQGDPDVGVNPGFEDAEVEILEAFEEFDGDRSVAVTDETLLKMLARACEEAIEEDPDVFARLASGHVYDEPDWGDLE